MAGDEYYLEVRNDNKDILDEIYLGKLRYNNMFVISNWRYESSYDSIYINYYEMEMRKRDNEIKYSI